MAFKIEKGVAMPESLSRYPFAEMEVGDSFVVPTEDRVALRSAISSYSVKHSVKFATRTTDEGVRCWRIE